MYGKLYDNDLKKNSKIQRLKCHSKANTFFPYPYQTFLKFDTTCRRLAEYAIISTLVLSACKATKPKINYTRIRNYRSTKTPNSSKFQNLCIFKHVLEVFQRLQNYT